MDKHGTLFANRLGTPTVVKIDRTFLSNVAIHAYEWRHARLWSLSRFDLVAIERTVINQPKLTLKYEYTDDSWKGSAAGQDVSDAVNPFKANYILAGLETLEVARWLSPADPDALAALATPELTLVVEENRVDERGKGEGRIRRELQFAPAPGPESAKLYYGRLVGDRYPVHRRCRCLRKIGRRSDGRKMTDTANRRNPPEDSTAPTARGARAPSRHGSPYPENIHGE